MDDGEDVFGLERFVEAQNGGGTYDQALSELRVGRKLSHWMWFVFPQVAGLGRSPTAQLFAISGLEEARAYLAHPVLGPRLAECVATLTGLDSDDPVEVFGGIDATKLRSSMTLFAHAAQDPAPFLAVLAQYFGRTEDDATLAQLRR